ncbi:hypothetical protein K2Y11_12050 [bacterium]|nr:hypothetical protein [bacterium]
MRLVAIGLISCVVIVSLFILNYPIRMIEHNPRESARVSLQFFDAAIVKRDYSHAYNLLSEGFKHTLTASEFKELINRMHLNSLPTKVENVEYEPIAGKNMMTIYISASSDSEIFYYRIVTCGNSKHGYQIDGVFRGTGPYPKSPRQKIGRVSDTTPR